MKTQDTLSPASRFARRYLVATAMLACGTLLTACGGGGGSDSPPATTVAPLSESDATADAANAQSSGDDSAAAMDTVVDTTTALAQASQQPSGVAAGREQAESARPSAAGAGVSIACAGGGTATLAITGGTAGSELNGQLDAGEHYSVTYAQCTGRAGWAQLNGSVELDVTSADYTTSPSSVAVSIAVTNLALTLPAGTETLNGTATVSRSVVTSGATTTTTSHVTVPSATLVTAFNSRSGSFTLTNLDATRTRTSVGGVTTASQYTGQHTLSGSANGRTFSMTVATTGTLDYDATGALVSGAWKVVRPTATIAATLSGGTVVLTVDDGSDGTIDHTWTFPQAQLNAAAG
jgi:hypothetical protein